MSRVIPILLGFISVSLAFNATVPLLEAPDEPSHVAMVRYIEEHHSLPVQRPPGDFPVGQEGSQPPLYYILGAALLQISPGPALAPTFAAHNPFVTFERSAGVLGNRNLYAHTPRESFPYRGDVLGIHLVRLLGSILGCVTVLFTFLIAREIWPRRPFVATLAAALVAFNPEFAFIAGVANNDNLIAAAATVVLWCLVRWTRRGGSTGLAVALGLALGAAMLAKTDGSLLIPLVGLVLARDLLGRGCPRLTLARGLVVACLAAAMAGWWFVRNQLLYGDPLGWDAMLAANGSMLRHPAISIWSAVAVLWRARGTFWGAFGWTNVFFPATIYQAMDVVTAVGVVGLVLGRRQLRVLAVALLLIWPPLVFASLVRWVQVNEAADQWRLLFAAVAPLAVLLALGLDEVRRSGGRYLGEGARLPTQAPDRSPWVRHVPGLFLAFAGLAINGLVLSGVVAPAFYPTTARASGQAKSSEIRFGGEIALVKSTISPTRLSPGEPLEIDLEWRALQPITKNWAVSLGVADDDDATLAKVQSWPQGGRAPTTAWVPGTIYHDRYVLTPTWTGPDPRLASVWLNLYDASVAGGPSLSVADSSGKAIGDGVVIGRVKLAPAEPGALSPRVPVSAQFGSAIGLLGYDSDRKPDQLDLTLYWHDVTAVSEDYTVFVHVADASGKVVAQHDSPPRGGAYPTTAWEPGETIRDEHAVNLAGVPPGQYQVLVGIYRRATGARLSVRTDGSAPAPNDALRLFELTVPAGGR